MAQLARFPAHREAKGQVQRWYDSYRIVVSEVKATYGGEMSTTSTREERMIPNNRLASQNTIRQRHRSGHPAASCDAACALCHAKTAAEPLAG